MFYPPLKRGMLIHFGAALVLFAFAGGSFWFAFQAAAVVWFVVLLILAILCVVLLVMVIYRMLALNKASYQLERDGLRLRWGLRSEDIPLTDIEWVRPANQMGFHFPLPLFWLPGSILGKRTIEELGAVEYLASEPNQLLLVATPHVVYAISPEKPGEFLKGFQSVIELGSLSPLEAHSAVPVAYLAHVWQDLFARRSILAAVALAGLLLGLTFMLIPSGEMVSLGFAPDDSPLEPVPISQVLLIPFLSIGTLVVDVIGGLFFYRKPEQKPVSYLLWISSSIASILLIIALQLLPKY